MESQDFQVISGVGLLLLALRLEYRGMHLGLRTIDIEILGGLGGSTRRVNMALQAFGPKAGLSPNGTTG